MRINHNMSAIFANRHLKLMTQNLDRSIERLSSGQAINKAGDDASGLAVSEKMRTQINGLFQAEKNTMNGLSFIQVAEGSLQQINDILQRVRTLSVQAANGIYSNQDRQQIQVEVSSLIDEIVNSTISSLLTPSIGLIFLNLYNTALFKLMKFLPLNEAMTFKSCVNSQSKT